MPLAIAGVYKRKEYGWFVVWLALVIVGVKFLGIGGGLGGFIIAEGLYRTIKSPTYSTGEKILLFIGYVLGGVAIAVLITFILLILVHGITGGE